MFIRFALWCSCIWCSSQHQVEVEHVTSTLHEHFALVYKNLLIWTVYTIINGRHSFNDSTTICLSKRSYMYIAIIGRSVRCLAGVDRPTVFYFSTRRTTIWRTKKITHQHYLFQQNTVNLFLNMIYNNRVCKNSFFLKLEMVPDWLWGIIYKIKCMLSYDHSFLYKK